MSSPHKKAKARGDSTTPLALQFSGISKSFGHIQATQNVDLSVYAGAIHGIIGENGAGKSSLVSILYGFYKADKGKIKINGKLVRINTTTDAINAGIGMVHQHFMLVPNFTVLENILLGHEGTFRLNKAMRQAETHIKQLIDRYDIKIDMHRKVESLPLGQQQHVEILKALYRGANILILDEPTGVLTPQETEQLFLILDNLRLQGVTILLITHKLKEIMAITDYVSVMRAGKMVAHLKTRDTYPEELAQLMVGRQVLLSVAYHRAEANASCLELHNVTLKNTESGLCIDNMRLTLKRGEILGVAGVSGNGQSELLEVLYGMRRFDSGTMMIGDYEITPDRQADTSVIKRLGVAHIPEDRHATGLVLPFTAAESALLGHFHPHSTGAGIFLSARRYIQHCHKLMQDFDIRPNNPQLKSMLFSGGNQQKIVLAREISSQPEILLVGQPTRGVDIGAIEFIHKQLLHLRDQGCAILLVSVELDEILSLSDRIMVMHEGRNMGVCRKEDVDMKDLGMMMAGVRCDVTQDLSVGAA